MTVIRVYSVGDKLDRSLWGTISYDDETVAVDNPELQEAWMKLLKHFDGKIKDAIGAAEWYFCGGRTTAVVETTP